MMEAKLRCTLFPGQFSSELAAVIRSSSGREYSLFAQKNALHYESEPTDDNPVQGWIDVEVVDSKDSLCLVRLPESTLENGQYVTVTCSQLDKTLDQMKVVER